MAPSRMRADAFASVSRIVDAARRVFASGDGRGSLSRVAEEAGVGIATLYRHFPNRAALARAVYDRTFEDEVQPLLDIVEQSDAPRALLLDLFERVLDVLDRQRGVADSLEDVAEATGALLRRNGAAIECAVRRAQAAGNLRDDLLPSDVPKLLTFVAAGFGALNEDPPARRRYLNMLLDGLNPSQAQPLPA